MALLRTPKRRGYLLAEILVAVSVLVLISWGLFAINQQLVVNVSDLRSDIETQYFGEYVFDAVRTNDPVAVLGEIPLNTPFYLAFQDNLSTTTGNQLLTYSLNPGYRSRHTGYGSETEQIHEIVLVSSETHDGTVFRTYKIFAKKDGKEITAYLTR